MVIYHTANKIAFRNIDMHRLIFKPSWVGKMTDVVKTQAANVLSFAVMIHQD